MVRPYATPEQWGQERVIPAGAWVLGAPQVILQRDPPPEHAQRLPQVNTLLCGVENLSEGASQNYNLRWSLTHGVGGAREEVRFDAVGFTRIALPVDGFTLALVVERFPEPFPVADLPDGDVHAFAMVGEGGIGQDSSEGATYTQGFELETTIGADLIEIPIPRGASAFRLLGKNSSGGGIATPFATTTLVSFVQGGTTIATLVGLGAAPADPSLYTLYYSGDWFPLPGSCTAMQFANSAFPSTVRGQFQFKIDL